MVLPVVSAYPEINGIQKLITPGPLLAEFNRAGIDSSLWAGRANSFRLPRGKESGVGYIIMRKVDYLAHVIPTDFTNTLKFTWGTDTQEIKKLGVVAADAITGVDVETDDTLYLITLADLRYVAKFSTINRTYNIQSPDNSPYAPAWYFSSLTPAVANWTWLTMVQDIWDNHLPSALGSLDTSEHVLSSGIAEGFNFQGWNAWDALHVALSAFNHSVVLKPDGTFKIVSNGSTDSNLTTLIDNSKSQLIDASHSQDTVFVPETVRVYFPKNDWSFQSSNDPNIVHPRNHWETNSFYNRDVATSSVISGRSTISGTVVSLHHPLRAVYTDTGAIQNDSVLNTQAIELATEYLKSLDQDGVHNSYHGVINFEPSSRITEVMWHEVGEGMTTEITTSSRESMRTTSSIEKEYPGPADTMRVHSLAERIVIGDLLQDVSAQNGVASARVQFGDFSGTAIAWSDTPINHTIEVHLPFSGQSFSQGDRVVCWFHQQVGRWLIIGLGTPGGGSTPNELHKVKALVCKDPGEAPASGFDRYDWGGTTWDLGSSGITVNDDDYAGSFLPGEWGWAVKNGTRYDLVGTYGLSRRVLVSGVVECHEDGSGLIVGYTIETGSETEEACYGVESNCSINFCNGSFKQGVQHGYPRRLAEHFNELVHVRWYERKWHVVPTPAPTTFVAELYESMCGDETFKVGIRGVLIGDRCIRDEDQPTEAFNILQLEGASGDLIFIQYVEELYLLSSNSALPEGGGWIITQVMHIRTDFLERMVVPIAPPTMTPHTLGQNPSDPADPGGATQSPGCDFKFIRRSASMMTSPPAEAPITCDSTEYDIINFAPYLVMSNLTVVEPNFLQGLFQVVWSPIACATDSEAITVITGTICPPPDEAP